MPSYVRRTPAFFKLVPGFTRPVARTIYPWIFLPGKVVQELEKPHPNPFYVALLVHEKVHYERQKQIGLLMFGARYLFSNDFRMAEEKIAVRKALQFLKARRLTPEFGLEDVFAPENLYLWPLSQFYSPEDLVALWHNA